MNNYSEQIFQSIDTIISQRLNEVSFDKTEICKIVSQNKDYPTRYWVTNEAGLKYEAYSVNENKKYFEGQKIYVTVPQGNYELRKLIIGAYSADEIPKGLYTNPFSQLVVIQKEELISEKSLQIKTSDTDGECREISNLTFTNSGLGQYDYLGIEFSLTTGFGGTTGEFQIILDPLDSENRSLISSDELGLFTISSKQLYGNPYYLNESLVFHHLFNFPIGSLEDLSLVKKIRVTLVSKGEFNFETDKTNEFITLNSLNLYVGYDKDTLGTLINNLVLDLDNTDSFEYEQGATETANQKVMSIDWFIPDTNTIYNENSGKQYPEPDKFDIYWLQYSDAVAYTKTLEPDGTDIPESGTYWKTVKKTDAFASDAYTYTLHPCEDWKKEQIKVIIKNRETGEYIQSNGLTFINKTFKTETGSNQGKKETLKLTLASGDDGVYNEYGIDNKRLTNGKNEHTITVDYIDNTQWNNALQEVIWRIPANNSMIAIPKVKYDEKYEPDRNWGESKDGYYEYRNSDTIDAKTVTFALSDQFGFGKVNNTISCEIKRYKYAGDTTVITDTYQGTLQLQFGTQGTSGSGYAFNLYPSHPYGLSNNVPITFSTKLENNKGEDIPIDVNKLCWYFMYGSRMFPIQKPVMIPNEETGDLEQEKDSEGKDVFTSQLGAAALTVTWNGTELRASCDSCDDLTINGEYKLEYVKYIILVAELQNFTDTSGNDISLKAYYPLAISSAPERYISGPSRIVYNAQGTSPNFDDTPYRLYSSGEEIGAEGETYQLTWTIKSGTDDTMNIPKLQEQDGRKILKPISGLQTNITPCRVVASQTIVEGEGSSEVSTTYTELWSQPLLILKNTYMFDFLNSWDGNLDINSDQNRILTQLIGAGVKNSSNQFSGVLLGAVGQIGSAATGLYGFEEGSIRYKLDENGAFYVGTGSDNFISFNEGIEGRSNKGELFIKTNKFNLDTNTLKLSSTEGIKLMRGEKTVVNFPLAGEIEIGGCKIDTNGKLRVPVAQIDGTLTVGNIQFGATSYYINPTGSKPYYINLPNFTIDINDKVKMGNWEVNNNNLSYDNKTLYFGTVDGAILQNTFGNISNPSVALKINNTFGVTYDGYLYAKKGMIGPISITDDGLGSKDDSTGNKIQIAAIWVDYIYGNKFKNANDYIQFSAAGGILHGSWKYGNSTIATLKDIPDIALLELDIDAKDSVVKAEAEKFATTLSMALAKRVEKLEARVEALE